MIAKHTIKMDGKLYRPGEKLPEKKEGAEKSAPIIFAEKPEEQKVRRGRAKK